MPDIHLEERIAGLEDSYREITKRIDDLRSEMHRGFDGVRGFHKITFTLCLLSFMIDW